MDMSDLKETGGCGKHIRCKRRRAHKNRAFHESRGNVSLDSKMTLAQFKDGDKVRILKVLGYGAFRKRLTEMGFVRGEVVTVVKNAPLKDPVEYSIMGYDISLRRSEAAHILVIPCDTENISNEDSEYYGIIDDEKLKNKLPSKEDKKIHVAFVGNPNCGKTTLYNGATGSTEHVGNYSGVTVDAKVANITFKDYKFELVDLPGTYSLTSFSQEEKYVREYIIDHKPDIIINVVDASNLQRNLYLTSQLIDMDVKVVLALNMYDEIKSNGSILDYKKLGAMLGIPIIPTIGSKKVGLEDLLDKVIDVFEDRDPSVRHIHINYGQIIEESISRLRERINKEYKITDYVSSRYAAIKLLEKCPDAEEFIVECDLADEIFALQDKEIEKIENSYNDNSETILTDAKFGFIAGALKETFTEPTIKRRRNTDYIDSFITHKVWGIPIFISLMFITFYCTFAFGQYPMEWIESGVGAIGNLVSSYMPNGALKDLLVEGVIGGVGGVIVYLPNILILFLFISLMEDTGYMARAAFIVDRVMHKIGLHGKSFIPLIMGFGCNVPAVMATRTLENKNDRILTILISPFMSCSARLPVYIVFIGAFFPTNSALVLFSMYFIGICLAILFAKIFKKVLFKNEEAPFVMELPPYRMPVARVVIKHMWTKASQYLKKMGGIILVASILIWVLGYFPREVNYTQDYDLSISKSESNLKEAISLNDSLRINKEKGNIALLKSSKQEEHQKNSYIGRIGEAVSPVLSPLGFDWKMSVSLMTGVVAKEVIVSTMGVLYQVDASDDDAFNLQEKIKTSKSVTPLVAFVFMLFILIYFPCIAVVVAVAKEAGLKWALFLAAYTTIVAWIVSFIVYNIGILLL